MTTWTSRVALIAYVIGGWLMPSLHHHDHSQFGHVHGVQCQASIAPSTADSPEAVGNESGSKCRCCCSHEKPAPVPADHDLVIGHPQADCNGLCALCVATTMLSTSHQPNDICVEPLRDVYLAAAGSLAWPLQPLPGGVSSRGPPLYVLAPPKLCSRRGF